MNSETESNFSSRCTSEILSTMFIALHYVLCSKTILKGRRHPYAAVNNFIYWNFL